MRNLCLLAVAAACALCLPGCSSTGISATAYNPGYGPFDRNGDYVEAWADKPATNHGWGQKPEPQPRPGPSVPTGAESEPVLLADNSGQSSRSARSPAPARRTQPSTQVVSQPARVVRPAEPKPVSRPPVVAATTAPKPAASPPKPKPTPKPKPAPKPTVRHTVAKGDTLYSLSRRYGTTVSAIQSANSLSGTTIRIGESLKIPK